MTKTKVHTRRGYEILPQTLNISQTIADFKVYQTIINDLHTKSTN